MTAFRFAALGGGEEARLARRIHTSLYRRYGIDAEYTCLEYKKEELSEIKGFMLKHSFLGINLSAELGERAVRFCDRLDEKAALAGTADAVFLKDGLLWGYCTTGDTFLAVLACEGIKPAGMKLLILGAGSAARGIAITAAAKGSEVFIASRERGDAGAIAEAVNNTVPLKSAQGLDFEKDMTDCAHGCDMLINALTKGEDTPDADSVISALRPEGFIYDAAEPGDRSELLRVAQSAGQHVIGGVSAFIWKQFFCFYKFLGILPGPGEAEMIARELGGQ